MKSFFQKITLLLLPVLLIPAMSGSPTDPDAGRTLNSLSKLSAEELDQKIKSDQLYILHCRSGLKRVIDYMNSEKGIFSRHKNKGMPFTREEGEIIQNTWKSMLDYLMALESVRIYHGEYLKSWDREDKYGSFNCYYSSFAAQYRYALEFLKITENDPAFATVLNETSPETGLGENSYSNFKFRYLNALTAAHFAAMEFQMQVYITGDKAKPEEPFHSDAKRIWEFGKGKGITMTAANAVSILKENTTSFFFPVQSGVAEWMGDTKIKRLKSSLISDKQLNSIIDQMEPGDILLERREWYLSNIGLPGYWPHAALYIGTAEERKNYFNSPEMEDWVRLQGENTGDFEELLKNKFPSAYKEFSTIPEEGHPYRIIEAMSEGVVFTTFEHSASCDSLAVLRPRLSNIEKARAVLRAFSYHNKPYDFNFDFNTESSIVCTEIVFRSYEPTREYKGMNFKLKKMLGRPVLPANDIVKQFTDEYKTPEQKSDLVFFLDGHEFKDRAEFSSAREFMKSCKRPKWHIFVQDIGNK